MSDLTEHATTEERRAVILSEMLRCVNIASAIWTYIADKPLIELTEGVRVGEIPIEAVVAIVRKDFAAPLSDERTHMIGEAIASSMHDHSLTTCGLWDFAHSLHHVLFDTDLPQRG